MAAEDDRLEDEAPPDEGAEEQVGYGRPPKHSRFKPGQSGNPHGRPKGAVGLKATLERVVLQEHVFVERGKRRRRTSLELLVIVLRDLAIAGKPRAAALFHDLVLRFGPQEAPEQAYIFMPELPSAEEQEQEAERVQLLEQQRASSWQPKQKKR
jgi:uncharacterized protein DUF5681